MKVPTTCPFCHDHMMTSHYMYRSDEYERKACTRINHHIIFTYHVNEPNILRSIDWRVNNVIISWSFIKQDILINGNIIPFFFEPDFSDHKNILKKIKTYLIFS